ncbi:hypothetical protein J4450_02185 [Candidatus Micrarchaeota archaeon]|nr:hypothetical protein [Candidatus Micrarchaeota archaeon]
MSLAAHRERVVRQLVQLRHTGFKEKVPEIEAVLKVFDRLNPESDTARSVMESRYTKLIDELESLLEMWRKGIPINIFADLNAPFRILYELAECVVKKEILAYVSMHSHGKDFFPQSIRYAFTNARRIIESSAIDIGLSVEPEGCGYAYFFELHGLRVLHVFADFDGKGGIDYRETEGLEALRGKRVLLIEDDVRTGQTLRAVLANIERLAIARLEIFLGNSTLYQNTHALPPQISRFYLNRGEENIALHDTEDRAFVSFVEQRLFEEYGIYR